MTKDDLLADIRRRLWEVCRPIHELRDSEDLREAALNDQEYLQERLVQLRDNPALLHWAQANPDMVLLGRKVKKEWRKEGGRSRLLEERAEEILGSLLRLRKESGIQGPLTDGEYYFAQLRACD